MATVFDVFKQTQYAYLEIKQSTIAGDMVVSSRTLWGIFKDRAGQVLSGNMESVDSSATLHVHPADFGYVECGALIGNGILYNGSEYTIVGATAGMNYETNELEHYRLTLQKAHFVWSEAVKYMTTEDDEPVLTENARRIAI